MTEKEFMDMFTNNICLLDPKVSLEAKGLYYSMLMNMYNEEHSFKEIIKSSRLDPDEAYVLLLDLIEHGYLYLSIKTTDNDNYYVFKTSNDGE